MATTLSWSIEHTLTRLLPDAWPSSATFDLISEALSDEADRKDAIKKGGAIFAINLKNDKGEQKEWYIDLKESGTVGKGAAPEGKKPTGMYKRGPRWDLLELTTTLTQ